MKKQYGNKLEGMMIDDNIHSLKKCSKCNDFITQEFANFEHTRSVEGERKTFCTWSCYSCRTEIISYQTK